MGRTSTSNARLAPPSAHAPHLLQALQREGPWGPVGDQLLAQDVPVTDDRFVPRLAALLDLAFYASMTTEEGRRATFSIAVAKPSDFRGHMFAQSVPVTVEALRKLSAACDDDETAVLVWFEGDDWFVWAVGLNEKMPPRSSKIRSGNYHLIISVRDAGAIDVRFQDDVLFTYAEGKGDVLGDQLWVADMVQAALPAPAPDRLAMHHLVGIQRAMRRHGRGGVLLVVSSPPSQVEIAYPMLPGGPLPHAAMMEETFLQGLAHGAKESDGEPSSQDDLRRYAIDRTDAQAAMIGRLTAIDGLVIIDHAMCVRGFGAKIPVSDGFGAIAVTHVNALDHSEVPTTVGDFFSGMRHKSAAAVCKEAGTALALVQSQDGALTVILAEEGELTAISPLAHLMSPAHRWLRRA